MSTLNRPSSAPRTSTVSHITSIYATDPDMLDLIQFYVEEIPERVRCLQEYWTRKDFAELRRIAHQMKGASGGYGFPTVGAAAGVLEHHLTTTTQPDLNQVSSQIDELIDLCTRVRVA